SAALSEPRDALEEIVEPYLLQQGLIGRTPRGRVLTLRAYRHLGLTGPTGSLARTASPRMDLFHAVEGPDDNGGGRAGGAADPGPVSEYRAFDDCSCRCRGWLAFCHGLTIMNAWSFLLMYCGLRLACRPQGCRSG